MRRTSSIIATLIALPLFWSCQNPLADLAGQAPLGEATEQLAARRVAGPVTVVPCPNDPAVDSAPDLLAAIMTSGPGGTVRLQAGTYYLATPVIVESAFNGAVRGAGRDQTVLRIRSGAAIASSTIGGFGSAAPVLFNFQVPPGQAASVAMSDLSIVVSDPSPGALEDGTLGQLNLIVVNATRADTTFERLRLAGAEFGLDTSGVPVHNVAAAIQILGYDPEFMAGSHVLRDSSVEHVDSPYNPLILRDGAIEVADNRFVSVANGPILEDFSNCTTTVTGNVVSGVAWSGVSVYNGWMPFIAGSTHVREEPSRFVIRGNRISSQPRAPAVEAIQLYELTGEGQISCIVENNDVQVSGFGDAMWLWNWVGTHSLHVRVSGNTIVTDLAVPASQPPWAVVGGIGEAGVQEAVIANNRISGSAIAGIYVGVFDLRSIDPSYWIKGWLIKANNVNDFTASVAPIWLGTDTRDCTVIGGNAKAIVLDQGTDNVITGMKRVNSDPLGHRVKDGLRRLWELKHPGSAHE